MNDEDDPRIPNISTTWQLWHTDTFDKDSSPTLQASGTNIVQGLYELWHLTLKEGILDNGGASFSRFQLSWGNTPSTRVAIDVNPFNNPSLIKLRQWANLTSQDPNYRKEEQRDAVLLKLAPLHYELLKKSNRWQASAIDWNAESREILARVESMRDYEEL